MTYSRPKVLAPILNTTVLEFWIFQLYRAGMEAIVINGFHLHGVLVEAVQRGKWPIPVHVSIEDELLGTGGGIRNALDFFGSEPFLVVNGDVLCDAPLREIVQEHIASGCPATLLLHDCPDFNNVAVDETGCILGFGKEAFGLAEKNQKLRLLAFTGIHVMDSSVLAGLQPACPADILTSYRDLVRVKRPPRASLKPGFFWREMGSVASYVELNRELASREEGFLPPLPTGKKVLIHPGSDVGMGVALNGHVLVGKGCRIHGNSLLEDTILWEDVVVREGSVLRNCIVTDGMVVEGFHENEILWKGRE